MLFLEQRTIEEIIGQYCNNVLGVPFSSQLFKWVPIPFSGEWGISTSFFQLAAAEIKQKNSGAIVAQRAQEIGTAVAQLIKDHFAERKVNPFQRIEAVKGYLNLYYSTPLYSRMVVDAVLEQGKSYGRSASHGKRVMVEYSQPNTHKAFHVGHLRNVILGDTVCNILQAAGYEVIRANYIGDIGLHVIKWLWNYMKYHAGEEPGTDLTRWMGDIYAEADRRLEQDPTLDAEVRALFARWDRRDPEVVALWEKTRRWSMEGFEQIYRRLGTHFDIIYYESEVEEPGKVLVEELIRRGLAIDERPTGPVVVKLDEILGLQKETYRVLVVLRSDGTSLYSTKDLALAIKKFEQFPLDRSIYVIDVRQSLYLQQIYKTLELMGYEWAKRCYHLAYELVNLPGNVTMSSREGTVVLLEDLLREAHQRALEIVREKNPTLTMEEMNLVAEQVALGAVKYPLLARENIRIATFDWQSALDFNGQAAPYIQYAHVRANSILKKIENGLPTSLLPQHELDPNEVQLIDWISRLPQEIQRAAQEYKPLLLTTLAYELARSFNDFYQACPVLKAEPEVKNFRIRLVAAAKQTLANILSILGIPAPELM